MLTRNRAQSGAGKQAGVGLIEVLIALVVLSAGLLGLAGLQFTSLQGNGSALMRSRASTMAYDILDSMRANRVSAENGDYDHAFSTKANGSSFAEKDLQDWLGELAALPGGDGKIERIGDTFTVTVHWQEKWDQSNTDSNQYQTFSFRTRL